MKARVLEGFLDVRHHIQARIFMCLIGVSLVSCMTFSVFWYSTNLKNAHDTIAEGNASSLYNVSELLDNVIESAAMNHVALLNDTTVQRHIESGNDTAPDLRWFEYYNYTLTFIKRYVTSKNNYVLGIRMILPDDSVCSFGSFTSNIESYPSMPLNQDLLYFEQGALYLARKVRSEGNGYVTILTEFAPSLFPQMFSGLTDDGATLYVYLNQSQLVRKLPAHAPDLPVQELELSNSPAKGTFTTFVNDHLMCRVDSSTYGLMYIYTVPMMKLRGSIGSIVYQLVTPCIIILLGVLIISILLSKSVTRGLVALSRNISRAATGDFSSLEMIHSEDEVGRLGQSFVDMTIQIDGLIKEINENEMDRHRMEMQVLRAQVSPHFLCNTLNSITYLASMQNIENIRQLSASLNELLQSALYIDDTLISLTEELDYVQHYFNIMKYRQAPSIEMFIHIEEAEKDCMVMRMTLQPIVENALIHGFASLNSNGRIDIYIYREADVLVISVTDNGVGMTEEQIRNTLNQTHNTDKLRFSGIGLPNVQKRIQMQFGKAYGLHFNSIVGEYTTIEIHMPYILRGVNE